MLPLLEGIGHVLTPWPFFHTLLGTTLGILVGAIPGLTGAMLIALTLPLTFSTWRRSTPSCCSSRCTSAPAAAA